MGNEAAGGLLPRQAKFCEIYAQTGNGAQAARLAGFSTKAAAETAYRLLRNSQVQQRLRELREAWLSERTAMLRAHVGPAIEALGGIAAGTESPRGAHARVGAAVAILDRAGFKPVDRVETNGTAAIVLQVSGDDLEL